MYKNFLKMVCGVVGHKWNYKDYTNWMKDNGDKYYFEESRSCSLCGEHEYYTDQWTASEKSRYDIEKDSQSSEFSNHD
jgi:hypothetical protein